MEKINAKCRLIQVDDLERIMNWRTMPEITKYLNTDPKLTMEDQLKWYEKIKKDSKLSIEQGRKSFYWVLEVDQTPAGVVSLHIEDAIAKRIATGVYIAEKSKRSLRLIIDLQYNLYRFSFEHLGMNKVCEEVFAENKAVNRILDMCGSTREGLLRNHIQKNGIYYDVITRGILASEWKEKKKKLEYNRIEFEY